MLWPQKRIQTQAVTTPSDKSHVAYKRKTLCKNRGLNNVNG
ncbi:hypothetical protein BN133_2000 [Cronobacter dublinensis 582]|nr:hypothetical protein BN133_2000 [Cronobacter dublinensis 582]